MPRLVKHKRQTSTDRASDWVDERLTEARRLGLSVSDLCELAGLARSNIRRWQTGYSSPGYQSQMAIEDALASFRRKTSTISR